MQKKKQNIKLCVIPSANIVPKQSQSKHSYFNNSIKYSKYKISNINNNPALRKQCLDDQFLIQRRQNHLNTHFNKRRNRLVQITKQNKNIYQRINAQKSFYSSRQLNKSRQSNLSTSRKSLSKDSRRSTSRKGTPSNSGPNSNVSSVLKNRAFTSKQSTITIQSQNIRTVNPQNLNTFMTLFGGLSKSKSKNKQNTKRVISQQKKTGILYKISQISSDKFKTMHSTISVNKKDNIPSSKKSTGYLPPVGLDGMLHRIQQQMYDNKKNKFKINKRVLY